MEGDNSNAEAQSQLVLSMPINLLGNSFRRRRAENAFWSREGREGSPPPPFLPLSAVAAARIFAVGGRGEAGH